MSSSPLQAKLHCWHFVIASSFPRNGASQEKNPHFQSALLIVPSLPTHPHAPPLLDSVVIAPSTRFHMVHLQASFHFIATFSVFSISRWGWDSSFSDWITRARSLTFKELFVLFSTAHWRFILSPYTLFTILMAAQTVGQKRHASPTFRLGAGVTHAITMWRPESSLCEPSPHVLHRYTWLLGTVGSKNRWSLWGSHKLVAGVLSWVIVAELPVGHGSSFPGGLDGKESACNAGDPGSIPWVGKILWRRKWQPILVFLPGESHGQRGLVGYSPCGGKELDTTEQLSFHGS